MVLVYAIDQHESVATLGFWTCRHKLHKQSKFSHLWWPFVVNFKMVRLCLFVLFCFIYERRTSFFSYQHVFHDFIELLLIGESFFARNALNCGNNCCNVVQFSACPIGKFAQRSNVSGKRRQIVAIVGATRSCVRQSIRNFLICAALMAILSVSQQKKNSNNKNEITTTTKMK